MKLRNHIASTNLPQFWYKKGTQTQVSFINGTKSEACWGCEDGIVFLKAWKETADHLHFIENSKFFISSEI